MTSADAPRGAPSAPRPLVGLVEWLHIGDRERVERLLADMEALGVTELRTGISWADWHRPEGPEWYRWLMPRLAREVNVLPCFLYTPPSEALAPKTCAPPRNPKAYADFLDVFITEFDRYLEWVELWNEPNNLSEWDWIMDPGWAIFAEMVGGAAYWVRRLGKRTVLGGLSPIDPDWLGLMCDYGVMAYIDAVGAHGFPGALESGWQGWAPQIEHMRETLERHGSDAEVWITETGFSTWHHDQRGQLRAFVRAIEAPVERVYWYSMYDLDPNKPTIDGFHVDEREYHFGVKYADGKPKPLYHLWAGGGAEAVRHAVRLGDGRRAPAEGRRHTLITGGAGFIGTNLAHRLLSEGRSVIIYDNLSRVGVERNLRWLRDTHGDGGASGGPSIEIGDVRDRYALRRALAGADAVYHLAAQVAVTRSLDNPIHDCDVNVRGTLNLLEEMRLLADPPPLIFTSTNKVYGDLADLALARNGTRYEPLDPAIAERGVAETRPLDFRSPYGCSKGAADQYVIDYARTFGLPAAVFRMSCIYGPHQFGTEHQGWIAHFAIRVLEGRPIAIYGDGLQVRDALYVDDLVEALLRVCDDMAALTGQSFNVGGGPANAISLVELLDLLERLHGSLPEITYADWRTGDQRYYISDTSRLRAAIGWAPRVGVQEGVTRLYRWLAATRRGLADAVRGADWEAGNG